MSNDADMHLTQNRKPRLERQDEQHYIHIYQNYANYSKAELEKAIDELVKCNKGLVIYIVNKIMKDYSLNRDYYFDDLLAAGILGLIEGIKRFDFNKDVVLTTYASYYVIKHIHKELKRLKSASRSYCRNIVENNNEYEAESEELLEEYQYKIDFKDHSSIEELKTENIKYIDYDIENFSDDNAATPEDEFISAHAAEDLNKLIHKANLTEIEKDIICRYNNLCGKNPETYEQISRSYNKSTETIRKISDNAYNKLVKAAHNLDITENKAVKKHQDRTKRKPSKTSYYVKLLNNNFYFSSGIKPKPIWQPTKTSVTELAFAGHNLDQYINKMMPEWCKFEGISTPRFEDSVTAKFYKSIDIIYEKYKSKKQKAKKAQKEQIDKKYSEVWNLVDKELELIIAEPDKKYRLTKTTPNGELTISYNVYINRRINCSKAAEYIYDKLHMKFKSDEINTDINVTTRKVKGYISKYLNNIRQQTVQHLST